MTQVDLELKYSKYQIKDWIKHNVEIDSMFKSIEIAIQQQLDRSSEFYTSKRVRYITLKKHTSYEIALELICNVLLLGTSTLQAHATILGNNFHEDPIAAVKSGAELLAIAESSGLYEIVHSSVSDTGTTMLIPLYEVDDDIAQWIRATMYLPPMVEKPREWTTNTDGGLYLTKTSCILGPNNHHEETQALDVLNKLQSIEWTHSSISNLDEPIKDDEGFSQRATQSKYVRSITPDTFYFVWKYDKRGRLYSQGYDINLQGDEYRKASIEFKNKEIINDISRIKTN